MLSLIRRLSSKNLALNIRFQYIEPSPMVMIYWRLPLALSVFIINSFGYFLIIQALKFYPCPFGWLELRLNSLWKSRMEFAKYRETRRKGEILSRLSSRNPFMNFDTALATPLIHTFCKCFMQYCSLTQPSMALTKRRRTLRSALHVSVVIVPLSPSLLMSMLSGDGIISRRSDLSGNSLAVTCFRRCKLCFILVSWKITQIISDAFVRDIS